jgi:hypothetical protein
MSTRQHFIQKYEEKVIGKISGFDRLVFRGTLRSLAVASGMSDFLYRTGVLLKDFGQYVQDTSEKLKNASLAFAQQQSRPIKYLSSSSIRKETVAREIVEADGIAIWRVLAGWIVLKNSVKLFRMYVAEGSGGIITFAA